jgi:hypothetical protein
VPVRKFRKVVVVEAVYYEPTHQSLRECLAFGGGDLHSQNLIRRTDVPAHTLDLKVWTGSTWMRVPPGNWIVKLSEDQFVRMSTKELDEHYEQIH